MKLNKKDIRFLILYTVLLIFGFIYIKEIFSILRYIIKIFMPFIIGIMIAFVLNVLMEVIENKWFEKLNWNKNTKRAVSLTLSIFIVIGFFIILMLLIIPNLQDTIVIFANNIPDYLSNLKELLLKLNVSNNVINDIMETLSNLGDTAKEYVLNNSGKVIEATFGIASNVLNAFINVFIGIVFAIYFLIDKEKISRQFNNIMKAYLPSKSCNKIIDIAKLSNRVFANFVSGQCLEAIIIGVLCFFGMIILRLPYAGAISVLVGFTALIPVFGAFIGTIVGAFLIFMVNPLQAVIFVIFIIVLQQLEGNLIYPHVVGKSVGLPGIWVLVAVTVGASINGILGMLLSVPLASIIYSILKTDVNLKLKKKNTKIIDAFCKTVEDAGYNTVIYSDANYFRDFLYTKKLAKYGLWVARWTYDKNDFRDYDLENVFIWQYSDKGRMKGCNYPLDLNASFICKNDN